jgi:hypothetical protein
MGQNDGRDDERPAHRVAVNAFHVAHYHVTNADCAPFRKFDFTAAALLVVSAQGKENSRQSSGGFRQLRNGLQRYNTSRRAKQRAVPVASDLTQEKQQLHELVDRLGPSQVYAVRGLLQVMLDPVSRAIANAPVDDEPLTAEEAHALNEAREWLKHNEPIPHEQVLAELGITLEEIENYTEPA